MLILKNQADIFNKIHIFILLFLVSVQMKHLFLAFLKQYLFTLPILSKSPIWLCWMHSHPWTVTKLKGIANSANQPISAKKGGMALTCQVSPRRTPARISIYFTECSTTFLAPPIKKMETYFALLYFWTFAECEYINVWSTQHLQL